MQRNVQGQSRMGHLANSCDAPFTAEYCVIASLNADNLKPHSPYNYQKIVTAGPIRPSTTLQPSLDPHELELGPSTQWLSPLHGHSQHVTLTFRVGRISI